MVRIPGQGQAWETLCQGLKACHAVEVSDVVLRHGLLVPGDAYREGLATDVEQLSEILVHCPLYLRIGED